MSTLALPVYGNRPRLSAESRATRGTTHIRAAPHAPLPVRADAFLRAEDGSSVEGNTLKGNPSIMGRVYPIGWGDGEVLFPGAFLEAIPDFLDSGFIADSHDWSGLPIGYPTEAKEVGNALYCEGVFHDHPEAQASRAVIAERLGAGKKVHLSIGFYLDSEQYFWFENGVKLLAYAQANSYPMDLFDQAQVAAWDEWILGVLKVRQLIEFSRVYRGANDAALMEEALGAPEEEVPPPARRGFDPALVNRANQLRLNALFGAAAPGEPHA